MTTSMEGALPEGAALACRDLAVGYGGRPVLAGLSFALAPGRFVGVLGANGAGKSTLLRTLAGLQAPLAGEIALAGRPLAAYDARALARARAYMAQQPPQEEGWRVRELVAMGRFPHQRGWGLWPAAEDQRAVDEALARAGVADLADRAVETLSGGQRQRVHLARALAQGAPLLFLDEPTAHLDLTHQLAFYRLVREVLATPSHGATSSHGAAPSSGSGAGPLTVVAVLHDLNLAAQFCHRLLLVSPADAAGPGALLADGEPEAVITPGLVARAFGLAVQVRRHPETGLPYVLPLAASQREPGRSARLRAAARDRLFVIAGGGSGERLLPALYRLGYTLGVGVVNLLDSDQALAERLGLDVVAEAPFSPVGPEARQALGQRLAEAATVVVADVAWGAGNVENLRVLAALAGTPGAPRIFLVAEGPARDATACDFSARDFTARDFTGGEAAALWEGLVAKGAEVLGADALLARLAHEAGGA